MITSGWRGDEGRSQLFSGSRESYVISTRRPWRTRLAGSALRAPHQAELLSLYAPLVDYLTVMEGIRGQYGSGAKAYVRGEDLQRSDSLAITYAMHGASYRLGLAFVARTTGNPMYEHRLAAASSTDTSARGSRRSGARRPSGRAGDARSGIGRRTSSRTYRQGPTCAPFPSAPRVDLGSSP